MEKATDIEVFDRKYTPSSHPSVEYGNSEGSEGTYETYGADRDYVASVSRENDRRVWTVVDGDGGSLYLVNGMAFVNRFLYVVTEEEGEEGEEYLWHDESEFEEE